MFVKILPLVWHRFVISLLAFFSFVASAVAQGETTLRVHFIDVGYADAILLEFSPPAGRGLPADTTTMLVDAGDAKHSSRLISYLKSHQIKKIDTVVITHPHQNHFGGLRKIAAASFMACRRWVSSSAALDSLAAPWPCPQVLESHLVLPEPQSPRDDVH